jgi:aspartate-semialdehyde dehydrogenase
MSGSLNIESLKNEIIHAFREETDFLFLSTKDFIEGKNLKAVNSSSLNSQLQECFETILINTSKQIAQGLEQFKMNQLTYLPASGGNNNEVAELLQKINEENHKKHRLEEELVNGMQTLKDLISFQKVLTSYKNSSTESEIQKRLWRSE